MKRSGSSRRFDDGDMHLDRLQQRRDLWRQRTGEEAEYWNWCATRTQLIFSVIQVIVVLVGSGALLAHKSLQHEVILGELVVAALFVVRLFFRHKFYVQASKFTGVKVRWYRPIPSRDEPFGIWCRRNGLEAPIHITQISPERGHLH